MKIQHYIYGQWDSKHIAFLKKNGIDVSAKIPAFKMYEGDKYSYIVKNIDSAKNFNDTGAAEFEEAEYLSCSNFLLRGGYPALTYPFDRDFKRNLFSAHCGNCSFMDNQIKPFVLKKEVTIPKKHLFFTLNLAHNYLFTDIARYKFIHNKWGLKSREVLIGKNEKISKDLVQIILPVSPHKLLIDGTAYDHNKRFAGIARDQIEEVCNDCQRKQYRRLILDYFPPFEEKFDFNFMLTQEWFGWYRNIIISRGVVEVLVDKKIIQWNSDYIVPVRNTEL